MASDSPFELTVAQQGKELLGFWATHRRALGQVRGTVAMAATLGRFVGLRRRVESGDASMVDDAVCFAVASYRTLSGPLGPAEALEVVEGQIVVSGLAMMEDWVPVDRSMSALGRQVRVVMGDAESRGIYEIDAMTTTGTGISWDVTACRYAQLTRELGSPEVGKVFSAVDGPFVSQVLPSLGFSCETTIARGNSRCRFRVGDEVER